MAGVHHAVHLGVRGRFVGVGSLLPSYGTRGSNSGGQVWQQTALPVKPFC